MTRPGDGPKPDADRDAHLVAALRHAPDAEAQAPPLLRARIVAAALRSTQASPAREPWHRRARSWLQAPWRMGGAGTLAAALLATTVLWVGRDEQPAAPDLHAPPHAAAPVAAPGKATAHATPAPGAAEPAATGSPRAAGADARSAGSPSNAATERDERAVARPARPATATGGMARSDAGSAGPARDTISAERAAAMAESAAAVPRPATAAPIAAAPAPRVQQSPRESPAQAMPSTPAPAPPVAPTAPAGTAPVAAPAAAPITAPETSPAPAPAPAPLRSSTRTAAAPAARQAPASAEPGDIARRRESAADAARLGTSPPATLSGAAGALAAPAGSLASGAAAGSAQFMRRGRATIVENWSAAADLAAWRWRAAGGEETALPTGWIAALAASTQGRWTPLDAGATAAAADTIQLVHQGSTRGSLAWLAGGVVACDASGRCEQASLDETTGGALREALRRR